MSQEDAAKALGISRDTLIRWEKGEGSLWTGGDAGTVDDAMTSKLKEVYGARFSELYPHNQYPSAPVDPALRQEWVWRRNAAIQKVPYEDYRKAIEEQQQRGKERGAPHG